VCGIEGRERGAVARVRGHTAGGGAATKLRMDAERCERETRSAAGVRERERRTAAGSGRERRAAERGVAAGLPKP
jgi:hypothetical protein